MRYDQLPPLAFLPTLEAAGRLGSFKSAAEALHITPSAVSQQIRAVEEALKVQLFERHGRAVVLTPRGERYLRDVRQVLRELVDAGQRLHQRSEREPFRMETEAFVAHEFLLPRISALRRLFPQLDVRLESETKVTDLENSDIDAAIRAGAGPWPGDVLTHPFGVMEAALVCAPQLASHIRVLGDLEKQSILEVRQLSHRGLSSGLRSRGLKIDPARVQLFETYYDVLRAAEHGLGAAIGVFPLTTHLVLQGKLAVPFEERSRLPGFMAVVHRRRDEQRFPYGPLVDWLRKEYDALEPLPPGRIVPGPPRAARKGKSKVAAKRAG